MLARVWPGTTPDYWMTADVELIATALAILDEESEEPDDGDPAD